MDPFNPEQQQQYQKAGPAIIVASATPTTPSYPNTGDAANQYRPFDQQPQDYSAEQFRQRSSPPTTSGPYQKRSLRAGQDSYGSSAEIFAPETSRSPSPTAPGSRGHQRDSTVPLVAGSNIRTNMSGLATGASGRRGGSIAASQASSVKKLGVTMQSRTWLLLLSYGPDWLLTIGLTGAFYLLDGIDGFRREFDLNDTSIQHTFAVHERVPNWMLVAICAGGPALCMPIINYLTVRKWWDFHNSFLGLVLSLGLTGTITNLVKLLVGRPRPDLIDRCQPAPGSSNAAVYGLATSAICTRTELLKDGFRSFPSGHSSLSFAGLGFLSFYLAGKLHLWDKRGHTGKAWLSIGPMMGAALVAASRTADYRHHWQDVTVGSLLGIVVAHFAYGQYYPALTHPLSHQPFSPRIPREEARSGNPILPVRQDSADSAYRAPMSAGVLNSTQLQQFSTPVNASPYEPRMYQPYGQPQSSPYHDASGMESGRAMGREDDDDITGYGAPQRVGSPPEGRGIDGTVPRPS